MDPGLVNLAIDPGGVFLRDLVIILVAAAGVGFGFQRLGLASISAYLVAGVLVGPSGLGLVADADTISSVSHLAILLLMFGIGLHMDTDELRGELGPIAIIGAASSLAATGIGASVATLFGLEWPGAILIGAALAMSSTAAIVRLLLQRRELRDLHGRIVFGTLIIQDLLAVIVLVCVPLLALWRNGGELGDTATTRGLLVRSATTLVGIAAIVGVGRVILPHLLVRAARETGGELVLIVGAAAALGSASATRALGFSPELGAFVAGFLLAGTPARHQLLGQLAPVRDLLIPVFFVAVGLGLDLRSALDWWWVVLLGLGVVVVTKAIVIGAVTWSAGVSGGVAALTGLWLAQAGEFSLVILSAGLERRVIDPATSSVATAIVTLSLMATPGLVWAAPKAADRLGQIGAPGWVKRRLAHAAGEHSGESPTRPLAVIAGFGPVGREVATRLERAGFEVSVIELNPDTVRRQAGLGRRVIYGDAANREVLERAGVARADAVVFTIPDHGAMLRACLLARELSPDAFIAVRSGYLSRGMRATELGANHIVIDEIATAQAMASDVAGKLAQRRQREDDASA